MSDEKRGPFGKTWSFAGTAVAVVASCVALTFTLFPGLIPDPKAVLAAKLTIVSIEPHVTLGRYEQRFQPDAASSQDGGEKDPGSIVFLRIKTEGKKHGHVRLDQVTYDWNTRNPIPEDPLSANGFRPDTPNDQWIAPVWVGDPKRARDYFVRLQLYDDDVMLDFVDTRRIRAIPDEDL